MVLTGMYGEWKKKMTEHVLINHKKFFDFKSVLELNLVKEIARYPESTTLEGILCMKAEDAIAEEYNEYKSPNAFVKIVPGGYMVCSAWIETKDENK